MKVIMLKPKATAEFIKNFRKSEELHEYLAEHEIQWEFILTKSPWRGAFYEWLNRDLKKMLYQIKAVTSCSTHKTDQQETDG